jgi:hypothetical protein
MPVPKELPIGLRDEFANDASRQTMWTAFLKKNELVVSPLPDIVLALRIKLAPALIQAQLIATVSK